MHDEPKTLVEAIRHYSDPENCFDLMKQVRWPDGIVTCPTCGSGNVGFVTTRRLWQCKGTHPKKQFTVKVGTIFEDSALGLDKWFTAMWMIANDKNGVSSYEIHRAIGVTQKSAWFMMHRIRMAMHEGTFDKFDGEIEVDETFIGGKARFMHKNRRDQVIKGTGGMGKAVVVGILDRHSGPGHSVVKATVVSNTRRQTLQTEIRKAVEPGSQIYTDALLSYHGLEPTYMHEAIDHAETYVNGSVHTNGMENFWSLLKRAIHGTYISIEPFHLFRYIDEEAFRFNQRGNSDGSRLRKVANAIVGKHLTYKELTR